MGTALGIGDMLYAILKLLSVAFGLAGVIVPVVLLTVPRHHGLCGNFVIADIAFAIFSFIGLFLFASVFEKAAALVRPGSGCESTVMTDKPDGKAPGSGR
jgi:hypothetical protein